MVSISRDELLKYGALLLIVVFVGETVFLGLSNNNSSSNSAASPSPTPVSFTGVVNASGRITQLGNLGLAVCPSSSGMAARVKNMSGVANALFATNSIMAIQFKANASMDSVEQVVVDGCQSPLFRSVIVSLPSQLSLNTSRGIQDVSTRVLEQYFADQGAPGFQAFVSPALHVNDSVHLEISVTVQDDQLVSVNAQQPQSEVISLWLATLSQSSHVIQNATVLNATSVASGSGSNVSAQSVGNSSGKSALATNGSFSNRSAGAS